MPYEFQPDPTHPGRNKYVGSWNEPRGRVIPLPFNVGSICQVLDWGLTPDTSPYTHQEIARWCDRMCMQYLDSDEDPSLEQALQVAADVDCQWDLFLANTYTI